MEIFRRGDEIVLREVPADATGIFDALVSLTADFMADGRDDAPPQEREFIRVPGLQVENWVSSMGF